MRQLMVQVSRGRGSEVLKIAQEHAGTNLASFSGEGPTGELDLVLIHVPNEVVGQLIEQLQSISPLYATLLPQGVLTLEPPPEEAADQVADVTERSPLEVFLSGIQSVGSWKGFLGYAAAAGGVVWIGLFTNTIFLLTAAMLIAPFAGPAMNASLATARGDIWLLGRSLGRYFAALLVTISSAALLSFVLRQNVATTQMIETSQLSSTAVLLPLIAGAAGALNLVQSDRSSLVSGAATGMLVAASLAPPAGLIGMAAVVGDGGMVVSGLFVLLLQIAGINFSGALVFRAFGLKADGPRYARGQSWMFPTALATTLALLAGLLAIQFWETPYLQHSTRQQRAKAVIEEEVGQSGMAHVVDANVRFTQTDIAGRNTLLAVIYAQLQAHAEQASRAQLREELTDRIKNRIDAEGFNVEPLVHVTLFDAD